MTEIVFYSALAVAMVTVVGYWARSSRREDPVKPGSLGDFDLRPLDHAGFSLAERLFDPADYLWLRDQVSFPYLARALARSRKQMALRWLRVLRKSFDELVRTPEPGLSTGRANDSPESWKLLWQFLRFNLLVTYAMAVVWMWGPYHRLIPSLGGLRALREPSADDLATKRLP